MAEGFERIEWASAIRESADRLVPDSLEVSDEKLRYLLTWSPVNDKSKILKDLGFSLDRRQELWAAIRLSCIGKRAVLARSNPEGWNYVLEEILEGSRKGTNVRFVFSFRNDGGVHLVTLYPGTKGRESVTEDI